MRVVVYGDGKPRRVIRDVRNIEGGQGYAVAVTNSGTRHPIPSTANWDARDGS